jgi:hypothetical protein
METLKSATLCNMGHPGRLCIGPLRISNDKFVPSKSDRLGNMGLPYELDESELRALGWTKWTRCEGTG